ncbi:MAG: S9 family peptidase, partial [Chloroflexota bacterium]|nr:S9 family peptidase [Chloroflexota bacterium]
MGNPITPEMIVYDMVAATDPRISPDGAKIVYALARTDRESKKPNVQLWLCDRDGSNKHRLTWSGDSNGMARWSPDGSKLVFLSDRGGSSGIHVLPVAGGEPREVTSHKAPVNDLQWSPDSDRIAYITQVDPDNIEESEPDAKAAPKVRSTRRLDYKWDGRGFLGEKRNQLFVVNVENGQRRQLTEVAQDHMLPQWSPDGSRLGVLRMTGTGFDARLVLIDVESGEEQVIEQSLGRPGTWSWSPSGDRIIMAADPDETGQSDWYVADVAAGSVRQVTDDLPIHVGSLAWGLAAQERPVWLDERQVLFMGAREGTNGLYVVDSEGGSGEPVQRWQATVGGLSLDDSKRYIVGSRGSFEDHGNVIVHDTQTNETSVITNDNAAFFTDAPLPTWERFEVQQGAYPIEGWLLKPPGFDESKQYPLVLDIHGGPQGAFAHQIMPWQAVLATHGFLVAMANPRGSSTYGRAFTSEVYGDWGGEDYKDLMAVMDDLVARPYVDAKRTGMHGYSYGGYMTSWILGQTDRFAACVCGAPPFDLVSMFGTSDISANATKHWGGTDPWEAPENYANHSPSTFAHRATTPTLIIQGEAD